MSTHANLLTQAIKLSGDHSSQAHRHLLSCGKAFRSRAVGSSSSAGGRVK